MLISPLVIHMLLPLFYAAPFWFAFANHIVFAWFVTGIMLGFSIFILDRLAHVFFIQPESEFSGIVREAWKNRRFREVFFLLSKAGTLQEKLMTRSVLFLMIYLGLAIFVITSTGSAFGVGMVLGIGLHFCLDFVLYRRNFAEFERLFLWQLKRKITQREVDLLTVAAVGVLSLFSLMVFR